MKVINTDRFLFIFPEKEIERILPLWQDSHLWLNTLRRMMIPSYVDRDTGTGQRKLACFHNREGRRC